jgi:hypothetical protein
MARPGRLLLQRDLSRWSSSRNGTRLQDIRARNCIRDVVIVLAFEETKGGIDFKEPHRVLLPVVRTVNELD